MGIEQLIFYAFSAVLVASAIAVVTVRNPVYAALFLVLCFFTSAAIWMLLEAEFLAITLVLVYVGAVMVLFLFVVMMLDLEVSSLKKKLGSYMPVGALVALVMAAEMFMVFGAKNFDNNAFPTPQPHPLGYSNTKELGELLYTEYVYPFEIAALILLVAIIAAITLTMRRRPEAKHQDPSQQVRVKKAHRLRVVEMESEKGDQS